MACLALAALAGCAETIPVSPCAGLKPIAPSADGYVIGSPEWQRDATAPIEPADITFDILTPRTAGQIAGHNEWMRRNCSVKK